MDKKKIIDNLDLNSFFESYIPSLRSTNMVQAKGLCPFHDDHNPSLSVNLEDGLYNCFACGASGDAISFYMKINNVDFKTALKEIGEMVGIKEPVKRTNEPERIHVYRDDNYMPLYRKLVYKDRIGDKFASFERFEDGNWVKGLGNVKQTLYNKSTVNSIDVLLFVEGEKDVDSLTSLGIPATTSGGVTSWNVQFAQQFKNKHVIIFPDNDKQGHKFAQTVAFDTSLFAKSVKIINLEDIPESGDISDWIELRIDDSKSIEDVRDELIGIIKAAPLWTPSDFKLDESCQSNGVGEVGEVGVDSMNFDYSLIPVTAFPFEVFPSKLLEFIEKTSKAFHVAPEVVACSILPIISSCIGNTVRISPKEGWENPIFNWLMFIAPTGYGKSPVVNYLIKHLEKLQSREYKNYQKEYKAYQRLINKKDNKDSSEIPEEPKQKHYLVSDMTIEALADVFEADPRGTLIHNDELAGLILGLNQFKTGKGNDRQHILKLYDAGCWKIDRKKAGSRFISNTGASIIGGIQPKVLPKVFSSDSFEDGLLPRFIILQVEDKPVKFSRETVNKEYRNYWEDLLNYCLNIPLELNVDGCQFAELRLNDEALDIFEAFYNEYVAISPYLGERARAFITKLIAYCLKFAGVLHVLRAYSEGSEVNTEIDAEIMVSAIKLTKYFAGQAISMLKIYDGSQPTFNIHEKNLIESLKELQNEVDKGKLKLSRIVENFNEELPKQLSHTPEKVSSMLHKFGLDTEIGTGGYSYLIWNDEVIKKLFIETTPTTPTNPTNLGNVKEGKDGLDETSEYSSDDLMDIEI